MPFLAVSKEKAWKCHLVNRDAGVMYKSVVLEAQHHAQHARCGSSVCVYFKPLAFR